MDDDHVQSVFATAGSVVDVVVVAGSWTWPTVSAAGGSLTSVRATTGAVVVEGELAAAVATGSVDADAYPFFP